MNTLDFYLKRKERFDERMSLLLEENQNEILMEIMKKNFEENRGRTNAQIDWNVFANFEELKVRILLKLYYSDTLRFPESP